MKTITSLRQGDHTLTISAEKISLKTLCKKAMLFLLMSVLFSCAVNADATDEDFALGQTAHDEERFSEALNHWSKAAKAGHAPSQYWLGRLYRQGKGVRKSNREAANWFEKSAKQGFAAAQSNYGFMFQHGFGVNENHEKAVYWYSRAAKQNYPKGMANLGNMYNEGWGVERDYARAFQLFSKAANQGVKSAQHNLGMMYHTGRYVARDESQARYWLRRSEEPEPQTPRNLTTQQQINDLISPAVNRVLEQERSSSNARKLQAAMCNQECGMKGGYAGFRQYSDPLAACIEYCYANFR